MSVRDKRLYLEDPTVSFDGFKALNKLSLYVDPGEMLCIIGPNGAGKTTMMDVITGKTRPDSGTAWFGDGIDLLKLTEAEIVAVGIGRKFQKPTVFEQLTVFENLELALAGTRSFLKTLRARITSAQHKRIDEVLDIILFRDGAAGKPSEAVHLLFSGEKTRPDHLLPAPEIQTVEDPANFRVITLESLLEMKLMSNRDKDRTHVRDMIGVGLIDATWLPKLPPELAERLKRILDTPDM